MNNYIYSILSDSEGLIWLGHDRGFSTYNPETGIARGFGPEFAGGGKCNPDGIYESPDGKVLIGTTEGLIVYNRHKDRKTRSAPVNNILSVTIGDSIYPYQSTIRLPYKKRYLVTIKYAGINLTDPDKVFYSTYMENHDDDWSEYNTKREAQYSLSAGKYTFNLVSVNEEGLGQEQALSFDISVNPPVWKSWWFLLISFAIFTAIIILIIRQRDKAAKAREKELQRQVDEKTEDVIRQKAEIERQNTEITDSINYAKRIQNSILPDISRLKEAFSDAFILYHPRDIVSGDFYWFDRSEDGKIVIVCADSTGHGVPGAFMSMIGSTLLHDIVKRQNITTPSKILSRLDRQIYSMLNQNSGAEISNDGMDMVVCEYNPLTRHLKYASAMRPVILIMDGESYYIKGNRLSVGGESAGEKFFVDQEYFLREGDVIYLFTDGISDQFGGPDGADGKKMKMNRLKRFVDELASLPASEQKVELSKFFYDWKGEYDQVDDVLFMGLRV
jgi:serine phosphatase RsbU (regulator of sigma subunit)